MRALLKKKAFPPLFLLFLLLLTAGIIAITRQSGRRAVAREPGNGALTDTDFDIFAEASAESDWDNYDEYNYEYEYDEEPPIWIPPGPPRWFRSNAGGMTLEEMPSRLAAIRNTYSLVIDYISSDELDSLLAPFYYDDYIIEIRVLFEDGEERRRQWIFRDRFGVARLNAVFQYQEIEVVQELDPPDQDESEDIPIADETEDVLIADESEDVPTTLDPEIPEDSVIITRIIPVGFIEIFDENGRIAEDYLFSDEGEETRISFFYNENLLIQAEMERKISGEEDGYEKIFTDYFRYNRSFSLRNVERVFHEAVNLEPVLLSFPSRALEAAANVHFLQEQTPIFPAFFGDHLAGAEYRILFDTDSRGRILTQTMIDAYETVIWVITNTWLDDRILSIEKVEGDNVMQTEYQYDSQGDLVVQRDYNNGVLERLVRIDGQNETEELYLDGVLVLRAFWEDGRMIHEERVRR